MVCVGYTETMDFFLTPENPAPPGAVCVPVKTADGITLRAMRARAPHSRGTVVIFGGRADYMERYFETSRDLLARGFSVASLDFRGQGGSERLTRNPMRGHVTSFARYDEDVHAFISQVVLPDCPPPYFLLAHSTGGNIALRSLLTRNWFTRCVVTSPLLGLHYGAWPLPVVHGLNQITRILGLSWLYLPGQRRLPFRRSDFPNNPLTHDLKRWNRDTAILEAAPQLATGGPTFGWLRSAMESFAKFRHLRPGTRLKCPVLAIMAGQERVVNNEETRRLAARIADFAITVIPESRHEILHETDGIRAQFFAAFETFVEDAFPR
jgi:lysophospholipase